MKPLYWGIIAVVLFIIIFVVYNNNQKQKAAELAAANANPYLYNQNANAQGGSQVAQIINSLLPFFAIGVTAATTPKCQAGYVWDKDLKACKKLA